MTQDARRAPEDWEKRVGPLALSFVAAIGAMAASHVLLKQWLPHKLEQAVTVFVMMAVSTLSTHLVFSADSPHSLTRRILTGAVLGIGLSGFASLTIWMLTR